ncbi:hydroxymethylpyrimidine pyrophosphatase-like HAD family hydrolase [Pseudoduganella lurida]|uniref:Hydroxymethylpyrimidine pyrophosphatase-like HAD family hydrolase n=1 Tax=Pseudoduganella lurida TaxID=1036180 RepID=A0A562R4R0_9BURK|nr:hypothetical protein [Pseudoduganella lurida]TWI63564.1 hydroxymethylpyrimidine pyrophosphatase-like HAD family hydrolase [Pseudoduganella lurida]
MNKFLFVDLDDTLFTSLPKCGADDVLEPVAFLKDGAPISYTNGRQRAFIEHFAAGMTMIPATARNRDALGRVRLPFTSYQIIDYGGIVLAPDGAPDPVWLARMGDDMATALPGLRRAMAVIDAYAERAGLAMRARLIEDYGLPFYVVVKDPDKRSERLDPVEAEAVLPWLADEGQDFCLHRNGNNLAIMPQRLNKVRAVEYVQARLREQHGAIMTFGMGDSRSDARFMAACDYAIIPRGTQLAALTVEAL